MYNAPDYTAGVAIGSGHTITTNGWVYFISVSGGGFQTAVAYIDGVQVCVGVNLDGSKWSGILPVKVGQVVTFSSMQLVTFYPV